MSELVEKKGLSGSTIKMVAIITMLIDHSAVAFLEHLPVLTGWRYGLYFALRLIGRLGFPIFCFLLVEGFLHTRSKWKYALRLLIFAFISEIPFDLVLVHEFFNWNYQNVYFTLLLGLLVMWGVSLVEEGKIPFPALRIVMTILGVLAIPLYVGKTFADTVTNVMDYLQMQLAFSISVPYGLVYGITAAILFILVLIPFLIFLKVKGAAKVMPVAEIICVIVLGMQLADLLYTDYAGMGVLTIAAMYLLRKNKIVQMCVGNAVLFLFASSLEVTAFLTVPIVASYNGKRGWNMKYVFYAFYPGHLLILYLLSLAFGIA